MWSDCDYYKRDIRSFRHSWWSQKPLSLKRDDLKFAEEREHRIKGECHALLDADPIKLPGACCGSNQEMFCSRKYSTFPLKRAAGDYRPYLKMGR
jgi:hypothetical protein